MHAAVVRCLIFGSKEQVAGAEREISKAGGASSFSSTWRPIRASQPVSPLKAIFGRTLRASSGSHPVFNPVPPQSALGLSLCIRSHSSDCALSATPPSVANLSSGTSSPAAFNFAIAELPVDAAVECHRPSRRHQGVSGQRIRSGSSALSVGMQCRKEADLMRIVATEGIRRFGKWVL